MAEYWRIIKLHIHFVTIMAYFDNDCSEAVRIYTCNFDLHFTGRSMILTLLNIDG